MNMESLCKIFFSNRCCNPTRELYAIWIPEPNLRQNKTGQYYHLWGMYMCATCVRNIISQTKSLTQTWLANVTDNDTIDWSFPNIKVIKLLKWKLILQIVVWNFVSTISVLPMHACSLSKPMITTVLYEHAFLKIVDMFACFLKLPFLNQLRNIVKYTSETLLILCVQTYTLLL